MVNYKSSQLDLTFSSLSDPTRREILNILKKGTATVSEIAEPFDISLPAISRHLKVMEHAGILKRRKEGRYYYLEINPEPFKAAAEFLSVYEDFWKGQLDQLGDFLDEESTLTDKS